MTAETDVDQSIFLSAAHGRIDNVERLLLGGCSAEMVFPRKCGESLESGFSGAVANALTGIVQPEDVSITSLEKDSLRGSLGEGDDGGGAFTQRCVVVSFAIAPGGGSPLGEHVLERILAPGFAATVGCRIAEDSRSGGQRGVFGDADGPDIVAVLKESAKVWKCGVNDRDKAGGYTAMHWAALNNQTGIIKMLVRHGAALPVPMLVNPDQPGV